MWCWRAESEVLCGGAGNEDVGLEVDEAIVNDSCVCSEASDLRAAEKVQT